MRTDQPEQEPEINPHLKAALMAVEKTISDLYAEIAYNQDDIKEAKARIEDFQKQLEVAETGKKYLQRSIVDQTEAARYLGGNGS